MTARLLQLTSVTNSFGAVRALNGVSFDKLTCLCAVLFVGMASSQLVAAELQWDKLSQIPSSLGVAGAFSGVSDGALLVAGGANFPGKKPWEGGSKVWQDDVFVLEKPDGEWRAAGKLPSPLGYGVALSHARGLVCAGGSGPDRHHTATWILGWLGGRLTTTSLPDLPAPRANHCGALLGGRAFLFGGATAPDSTNALNSLLSLDLTSPRAVWETLDPLPGPGRVFATAAAHAGSFFVFGGAALSRGPDGKPVRGWLRDAYRYTPGHGWKRIADLPRVAVAAPSPAPVIEGRILILGGDDGSQVATPPADHRGFRRDVLAYNPTTDKWETAGTLPFAHVTTAAVRWRERVVVPSGEIRPGIRSPEVWTTITR